jgi:deoxyribose-phosphate aldolase
MSIAQYIDHTILKPDTSINEIEKVCSEAIEYNFASVCIPPYFVKDAARLLEGTAVKVATVIGFPFGYQHYFAKRKEAETAIDEGAQELDMVMNLAAFKDDNFTFLEEEIKAISAFTQQNHVLLKVIIESGMLSAEEIIRCCAFYQDYPVQFLKTSTGYAQTGATIEAVQLMRAHLSQTIAIKASGGIRNFSFAQQLIAAGATRLGCSASVAIIKGEESSAAY